MRIIFSGRNNKEICLFPELDLRYGIERETILKLFLKKLEKYLDWV